MVKKSLGKIDLSTVDVSAKGFGRYTLAIIFILGAVALGGWIYSRIKGAVKPAAGQHVGDLKQNLFGR